jgi:dethiobiotin synthetase
MSQKYIIAGIGTGVGKTVVSAILVEALQADYWKPIQAGDLHDTDTDKVKSWVSNPVSQFHSETYRLTTPMSPHAAAQIDGLEIEPSKLSLPSTLHHLIIELAGGIMVPLRSDFLNIDFIKQLNLPVILVSQYYLGSINHTLLSLEILKRENVKIAGIVLNGAENPSSKQVILQYAGVPLLAEVQPEKEITPQIIQQYAAKLHTEHFYF